MSSDPHCLLPVISLMPSAPTKGRGFEGVVKRHRFAGGDSTHGAKGWHRRAGAIGQRLFPGTVMRGMRMPGHMGKSPEPPRTWKLSKCAKLTICF